MSNLGKVFRKWRSNLRHEIHATPSMNWAAGGTPVNSTTNFHIVGDLTAATSCYITGHGGADSDDYFFDNKTFRVPAGVTVNFYQPHGYILAAGTQELRHHQPVAHPTATDLVYTAGDDCVNYLLSKDQGRHLSGDSDYAAQWEMNYAGTQAVAGDMGIVMVTVRNRWFHAGVSLKTCIAEVTKAAPNLTTFNCLFCRVDENSGDESWDIEGFWST